MAILSVGGGRRNKDSNIYSCYQTLKPARRKRAHVHSFMHRVFPTPEEAAHSPPSSSPPPNLTSSRTMHKSSKPARSGLGTVKRDWSTQSSQPLKSSQEIPWAPTPPKTQETTRVLTGAEKRLREIQKALEECQHNKPPAPLTNSRVPNKRLSDEGTSGASHTTKKRRVLPWAETDSLSSKSGFGNDSIAGGSRNLQNTRTANAVAPSSSSSTVASSSKPDKLAAVFLSQEQTQILKLVQEGNSVFYTGSAGERLWSLHQLRMLSIASPGTGKSVLLREIIKVLRKKFVKTPDAVAITASTGVECRI